MAVSTGTAKVQDEPGAAYHTRKQDHLKTTMCRSENSEACNGVAGICFLKRKIVREGINEKGLVVS